MKPFPSEFLVLHADILSLSKHDTLYQLNLHNFFDNSRVYESFNEPYWIIFVCYFYWEIKYEISKLAININIYTTQRQTHHIHTQIFRFCKVIKWDNDSGMFFRSTPWLIVINQIFFVVSLWWEQWMESVVRLFPRIMKVLIQ